MPKRLLILCDGFGAPTYGPRMTQLCKHLSKRGWQITLLTEQVDPQFVVPNCHFYAMPYYRGNNLLQKAQWALDKLFDKKETAFYRFVHTHIQPKEFDVILCSSFNDFPLGTAYLIAKEGGLPLFVDLRDIAEQWGTDSYMVHHLHLGTIGKRITQWYQQRILAKRNRSLQYAKVVTTISPWHCQLLRQYNSNTHLIYNGFDSETFYPSCEKTDSFVISYIGRIYDLSFRNPRPMLQAVAELCKQSLIERTIVRIVFHIESTMCDALNTMVQDLGIQDICQIRGYVSRKKAQQILHNSAINVVLVQSETIDSSHGIMTTKFFEALGCEKPILCTPANTGCLVDTIRYTNAGIATDNKEEIKQFILEKYREWKANGYTHQEVQHKEQFSREYQARQFEELFLQCLQ